MVYLVIFACRVTLNYPFFPTGFSKIGHPNFEFISSREAKNGRFFVILTFCWSSIPLTWRSTWNSAANDITTSGCMWVVKKWNGSKDHISSYICRTVHTFLLYNEKRVGWWLIVKYTQSYTCSFFLRRTRWNPPHGYEARHPEWSQGASWSWSCTGLPWGAVSTKPGLVRTCDTPRFLFPPSWTSSFVLLDLLSFIYRDCFQIGLLFNVNAGVDFFSVNRKSPSNGAPWCLLVPVRIKYHAPFVILFSIFIDHHMITSSCSGILFLLFSNCCQCSP